MYQVSTNINYSIYIYCDLSLICLTLLQETAPAAHRSHPQRGTARWRRPRPAPWLAPRPAAPPGPARRRPPTTCRRRRGTSLGTNRVVWCFFSILDPLWSTPTLKIMEIPEFFLENTASNGDSCWGNAIETCRFEWEDPSYPCGFS